MEKRSGVALNAVRFGRRRSARRITNHVSAATRRCCRLMRCGSRCSCLWSALPAARGAVEAAAANRPSSRRRRAGNSTDRHVSFGAALVDATASSTARRMGDHALPGRVGTSFVRGGTTLQVMTGGRSAVSSTVSCSSSRTGHTKDTMIATDMKTEENSLPHLEFCSSICSCLQSVAGLERQGVSIERPSSNSRRAER